MRQIVRFGSVLACCFLCGSQTANAVSLSDAFRLAWQNDPIFLTAKTNLALSQQQEAQAVAALRPQLNLSANKMQNRRSFSYSNAVGDFSEKYDSSSLQLNLTQPVWRRTNTIAKDQAEVVSKQSELQLAAAELDLQMRLLNAWFELVQAQDDVILSQESLNTMRFQQEQVSRLLQLGVAAVVTLEDAELQLQQAKAELAKHNSQLFSKQTEFERMIGMSESLDFSFVSNKRFSVPAFERPPLNVWLASALNTHPAVLAANKGVEAANEEIRKQRAAFEPTVDLVASYSRNHQGAGLNGGQSGFDADIKSIGLQLNAPLYNGGGQRARLQQALLQKNKSEYELESARRQVAAQVKQAWFAIDAAEAHQQAADKGVARAGLLLKAAHSGKQEGLKNQLDVIKAQQQLVAAERDLRLAVYELLLNRLKLKASAGKLQEMDLSELDTVLGM